MMYYEPLTRNLPIGCQDQSQERIDLRWKRGALMIDTI